jgi:hypothetical protein
MLLDIKAGEETTISYNLGSPRQLRRERMKNEFMFDCTCDHCCLPAEGLQESESRGKFLTTQLEMPTVSWLAQGVRLRTVASCYACIDWRPATTREWLEFATMPSRSA